MRRGTPVLCEEATLSDSKTSQGKSSVFCTGFLGFNPSSTCTQAACCNKCRNWLRL